MGYCFACKKRAQGAQVFKNVQVLRKQIKNQKRAYGSETPWPYHQMPNNHPNNFGKLTKFRSFHLLCKQFINENKARRVRKKGA